MKEIFLALCVCVMSAGYGQDRTLTVSGTVHDATTKEALQYASVVVNNYGTVTSADGSFDLTIPLYLENDTLSISYVGFKTLKEKVIRVVDQRAFYLEESAVLLQEMTITYNKLNMKNLVRSARLVRENIYAMEGEVTNGEYNAFLNHLRDHNQTEQVKRYETDVSSYDKNGKVYFKRYATPFKGTRNKDTVEYDHNNYPAINIRHEAAVAYCEWLTEEYNAEPKKKKFKKVKFRLPTHQEWQMAALGYPKAQSWNLIENKVEVIIPDDTTQLEIMRGPKKIIPVDKSIQYPWYVAYYYRNSPQNSKNCFLGNFKVIAPKKICPAHNAGYDGFTMMAPVKCYFPNNIGLYDVVGNVAEMIDEKGKACGGSWDDLPSESTIWSVKSYSHPEASIGFRVFMEVIEK